MAEKLLHPSWENLDQHEFRLLLQERLGGPGQYDGKETNPNKFYLPLARDQCKVVLTIKDKKIVAVEAGQAFDAAQWQKISGEIEQTILAGPRKFGREYSFCSFRVKGSWRGPQSEVQILPPPPEAPTAPFELADHPFILEFPITGAPDDLWSITDHRRMREHRRLTRVLNVLVTGSVKSEVFRTGTGREDFWAYVPPADGASGDGEFRWLQRDFFAPLGEVVANDPTRPAAEKIEEVDPETYYGDVGHDGKPLRVPSDLDDSLCCYRDLSKADRAKFDRSTFWLDIALRQSTMSVSASFASLVSAIESLTERGTKHTLFCEKCGKDQTHESPGATERFHSFLETHAPGAALTKRRGQMYTLRSSILHGSDLMQIDQDLDFGWDPPGENEKELNWELWSITKLALRSWLKNQKSIEK